MCQVPGIKSPPGFWAFQLTGLMTASTEGQLFWVQRSLWSAHALIIQWPRWQLSSSQATKFSRITFKTLVSPTKPTQGQTPRMFLSAASCTLVRESQGSADSLTACESTSRFRPQIHYCSEHTAWAWHPSSTQKKLIFLKQSNSASRRSLSPAGMSPQTV